MADYKKFISPLRRPVPTPEKLVDDEGRCVFGTFESEFESMEFENARRPTPVPDVMNKLKLTLWEAAEICFDEGILLAAVSDMGLFGLMFTVFYDRRTKNAYKWVTNLRSKNAIIAPNLLKGSVSGAYTKDGFVKYVNDLGNGKCSLQGEHSDERGKSISYDLKLDRISKPSVVSIPFDDNRPLYSQKDFFKAGGKITINGETIESNENTVAIVDDHRGFYPRRAHYDWVTVMGRNEVSGEKKFFAVNLTRNQSIDQDAYNENLIWFPDEISCLTPVQFMHFPESAKANGRAHWKVRDEHDMVCVDFDVQDMAEMVVHAKVINIDYYIAFGKVTGYVRDEDGNKYILDGLPAIGEDKSLLF